LSVKERRREKREKERKREKENEREREISIYIYREKKAETERERRGEGEKGIDRDLNWNTSQRLFWLPYLLFFLIITRIVSVLSMAPRPTPRK
jgi:hypothetical protein